MKNEITKGEDNRNVGIGVCAGKKLVHATFVAAPANTRALSNTGGRAGK